MRRISPGELSLRLLLLLAVARGATAAAAAGGGEGHIQDRIPASDLPRNPQAACAFDAVIYTLRAAQSDCMGSAGAGPPQECCAALQGIYGNSSSPAYGCLCLPPVLYNTILKASDYDVNVLGLLKSCKQQGSNHGPPFLVEWAGQPASRCPDLELSAGPVEVLIAHGRAPVLEGGWPSFAWSNLKQAGQFLVQHTKTAAFVEHLLGKKLLEVSLQTFVALPLVFLVMHHAVLMPLSKAYRKLPLPQRLVTCQHAVYAAVFGASLFPQTVMACRFILGVWDGQILQDRLWTSLVAFIMSRCGLYLIEAGVRAVNWSGVLFAHHVIFLAVLAQNVKSGNPALGVIGVVMDLFACHEAPLYVALVVYRLGLPTRVTRGLLRGAVVWYIITRVLQTAILAYLIADLCRLPQINRDPRFVATAFMCAALTVIQGYTVAIYRKMDRKLGKQAQQHQQQQKPSECVLPAVAAAAAAGVVSSCQQLLDCKDASAWVSDTQADAVAP